MIRYLTVHDLVWVNNVVTGKKLNFDYEKLEACMAAQYQYGDSSNVKKQAAYFLQKLLTKPAFECGNKRTAFIATGVFLLCNGFFMKAQGDQLASIFQRYIQGELNANDVIEMLVDSAQTNQLDDVTIREMITLLCSQESETLQHLAREDDAKTPGLLSRNAS